MNVARKEVESRVRVPGPVRVARKQPAFGDYYELLVSRLQVMGYGSQRCGRTIGITSSGRREGTTTIVANLALCAAQGDATVLIVDANLAHPAQHRFFAADGEPGLGDMLREETNPTQLVQSTRIHNISLVAAGTVPTARQRGLPLVRVANAIDELAAAYDWVLVDLPAASSPSHLIGLAPRLHGVLLVVEAERVSDVAVAESKSRLEDLGTNLLGVVFNKCRSYLPRWVEGGARG